MTGSAADLRSRVFTAMQATRGARIERVTSGAPVPPGFTMWRCGRSAVALPTLLSGAPIAVWRRYLGRVESDLTGRCPLCGAVADVSGPSPEHPASWQRFDVLVGVNHATDCPTTFGDDDRQYFDARIWR